ncbi:zinc finger protein 431-like [Cricetulus griseus]|uniref:Zinc finger protein 431-like n=1 Tax=Cricetulus griseus TaxID=10029 RepID=A0A9J7K4L7_CRIGR|nr:zinc finger protein 431-like [Cricetulus griseus]
MGAETYDDVHINFSQEEWALLGPFKKSVYKDVLLDTDGNLIDIGYSWEDHNIEENCQTSRRHRRGRYPTCTYWKKRWEDDSLRTHPSRERLLT